MRAERGRFESFGEVITVANLRRRAHPFGAGRVEIAGDKKKIGSLETRET